MNWLKKIIQKNNVPTSKPTKKESIKDITYPPKVILAWTKALQGHTEISLWLNENGYKELVVASSAILLKQEARDWLMKNGYPHLMAMINAAEGDENAQKWLLKYNFNLLYHIAMVAEYNNESMIWLKHHATPDLYMLALAIRDVKDKIEDNHNDIHSYGRDL